MTQPANGVPSLAEVTAWYRRLLAADTYETACGVQAFLYDPLWSEDAELERVFEAWAEAVVMSGPMGEVDRRTVSVPLEMIEDHLVETERFDELRRFFTMLSPALLERALPLARALVAKPRRKRDTRYDEITE